MEALSQRQALLQAARCYQAAAELPEVAPGKASAIPGEPQAMPGARAVERPPTAAGDAEHPQLPVQGEKLWEQMGQQAEWAPKHRVFEGGVGVPYHPASKGQSGGRG